jgi:hypothetical protein
MARPTKNKLPQIIDKDADAHRLEFLARHVYSYASGPGRGKFGFDFYIGRKSSDSYYDDFRRVIDDAMRGR